MRELLVREAHGGGLMGHFGVRKTLDVLHEHFFLLKMKHDVERACARCITCRQAKSTLQGKKNMVTFIISHYKHRVSLQHSVTLSTDTIEGINW